MTIDDNERQSLTIAIVDDSPEDRFATRRLLERSRDAKFTIHEADSGARGLALCAEIQPDCVVLDFHLGDMEATDFLAILNQSDAPENRAGFVPVYPVVVLTARGTEATAVAALQNGAQDYLLKESITSDSLVSAVNKSIQKVSLQRQLRDSQTRFRASLDNMLDSFGIFAAIRGEDGRIVGFEPEYLNYSSRHRGSWNGLPSGDDTSHLFDAYTRVVETGQPLEINDYAYPNDDYSGKNDVPTRYYDIRAWKMDHGFAATWRDITERVESERKLTDYSRTLRFHVENTPLANIEWDGSFRIITWSERAEQMFGWRAEEVLGKKYDEFPLMHPDAMEDAHVTTARMSASESNNVIRQKNLRKDGSVIYCEWHNSVARDASGRPTSILSLVQDVTEQEEARLQRDAQYHREHEIAVALQQSLLTHPQGDAFPGLQFYTLYRPAFAEAEVGGDLYDVFALPDGRVAFVVGDISGKGIQAAQYIAEIKFSLRAYLRSTGEVVRALERVNADLFESLTEYSEADGFSTRFVCISLALIDSKSGTAEVVSAGGEPPLLVRGASGPNPILLELSGVVNPPLGVTDAGTFVTATYPMEVGDLIVQVTDGITEARRGRAFLGYEGMSELVRRTLPEPNLAKIGEAITQGALSFANGVQRDDVCLLVLRRTAISD